MMIFNNIWLKIDKSLKVRRSKDSSFLKREEQYETEKKKANKKDMPSLHKARRYKDRGSPWLPSLCRTLVPPSKFLRARKCRIASRTTQYFVKHSTNNLNKRLSCYQTIIDKLIRNSVGEVIGRQPT